MKDEIRLLEGVTAEERRSLAKILDWPEDSPSGIAEGLWWNCQSVFGYIGLREPDYKSIVLQCLGRLDVQVPDGLDVTGMEALLVHRVIATAWKDMTDQQREALGEKIAEVAALEGFDAGRVKALGPIGLLTAAQLSGFGIYLFASTALSAIVGVAGVTLPFAAYTLMSSTIALVIGPVGWTGAGLFAIWKLTEPRYKRLIPAILLMSILRTIPNTPNGPRAVWTK